MREVPNIMYSSQNMYRLKGKIYLEELDFIKENTLCNYVVAGCNGIGTWQENLCQSYPVIKEIVEHAHEIGLKVVLRIAPAPGFYNAGVNPADGIPSEVEQAKLFPIPNPYRADAIVQDYEVTLDDSGYAEIIHNASGCRAKIAPIYSEVLQVYAFEKTGEGFYKAETLVDLTENIHMTCCMPAKMELEIYAGKENAGKTVFVMVAQYYNYSETGEEQWQRFKKVLDSFADIPLDGVCLDEFGMVHLMYDPTKKAIFRGRRYSRGMKEYYENELKLNLAQVLFDMRYAPQQKEHIRIRAINRYFEALRYFPLYVEKRVADYAKQLYIQHAI